MVKFVKFVSATDPNLEVHVNPEEVAAVRDSHGKTIIFFRSTSSTETVRGAVATVAEALSKAND